MHTGTLKKLALALTFWLTLHASYLKAQILGPLGTTPYTFEVDSNGLLSATGSYGTGTLSLSGAGTRMFWYPSKAAFRAGYLDSGTLLTPNTPNYWNDSNIGAYSIAFGKDTEASGEGSIAMGEYSTATGLDSVAIGQARATDYNAIAIGSSDALGYGATALGWSSANAEYSFAGNQSTANGIASTAIGYGNTTSGYGSNAFGIFTSASGYYSTASGFYVNATSYSSFVTGFYNLGTNSSGAAASATTWIPTDPLFEVGNGGLSSSGLGNPALTTRSDAFVVYKNGNAQVQGTLRCSPGGDLSMGNFTAGTAPSGG